MDDSLATPAIVNAYAWGLDLSGTPQGAGGVGGLLWADLRGQRVAYAYDGNGNVLGLVDAASGGIVARYDYDPFGNIVALAGPLAGGNPFRFSTKYTEADTRLDDYGLRWYRPDAGRWLSRDPIGEFGGLNLYGYVGDDPINRIDPLGERWPDYWSFNLNIAIPNPFTGTVVGWSGTLSVDRNGNFYWSPIGVGVGKSATAASCSLTANWLDKFSTPSPQLLNSFLTTNGFNAGGGFIGGGSESYTPGSGFATGVGLYTPQVGGSWNYSFPVNNSGGHGASGSW